MRAYRKDIWRTLTKGKRRFVSIMLITALGVMMLTGLRAACTDLRFSADAFYDQQNLFDISVMSTLGMTEGDVDALRSVEGVLDAEGGYSETVRTKVDGREMTAEVRTFTPDGMNVPYVLEGTLPEKKNEIAVTRKYCNDTGKTIGDTVAIREELAEKEEDESSDETPNFTNTEFVISAIVIDVMDINSTEGASSFRSTSTTDHIFFVTPEAVNSEIYTAVYLTVSDVQQLLCYSDAYDEKIDAVIKAIETDVMEDRKQIRYNEVIGDAEDALKEAESELADGEKTAQKELQKAKKQLDDAKQQIVDGKAELQSQKATFQAEKTNGLQQLQNAQQQLELGEAELQKQEAVLLAGIAEYEASYPEAIAQIESGEAQLAAEKQATQQQFVATEQQFAESKAQLDNMKVQLDVTQCQIDQDRQQLNADQMQLNTERAQLEESKDSLSEEQYQQALQLIEQKQQMLTQSSQQLDEKQEKINQDKATYQAGITDYNQNYQAYLEGKAFAEAEFAKGEQQLQTARKQLVDAKAQLDAGLAAIAEGKLEMEFGKTELQKQWNNYDVQIAEAEQMMAEAEQQLLDAEKELADGEKEYAEGKLETEKELQDAKTQIADARKELEDIHVKWYVQNRDSLGSYSGVRSDAGSIEAIGNAFPVIFLAVAILISLTTITRMVEEDRGLIGTYKALGFTDREIRRKYLIYAATACITGGILGDLGGFILLPKIIEVVFSVMYQLPSLTLTFDFIYGIGGVLLFIIGIVGATFISCEAELKHMPATLMRPKAPRAGSRVFLEYITPLWKHLSFLNKVTARNLFRYKKRLFMTIIGIAGCTALVLCGFVIKDSVTDLMPAQYERVYQYDLMAVADDNETLLSYVEKEQQIEEYRNLQISSVKLINNGKEETVQLFVVPEGETLENYINLVDTESNAQVSLDDSGVLVTQNAGRILEFGSGDTISMQTLDLEQGDVKVKALVKNYMGNNIFVTEEYYKTIFTNYEPNGILANLSEDCTDHALFADELGRKDGVLSSISVQVMKDEFATAFSLVNMVVYLIIAMAAGLALLVLFTLSTTNISERNRELATIKVLGFYDREVHMYVNKETLILTGIGIAVGLPLGYILGSLLTVVLNMPNVHFATTVSPISFLISAAISFAFAIGVNLITNRVLDKIDPVEALKSIE